MLQQTFLPDTRTCVVFRLKSETALIFCTGLATSMSEPRYLWSIMARQAFELGFSTFQFDYLGDGDSPDNHFLVSTEGLYESMLSVMEFARSQGCREFGLIGYGIGTLVTSWFLAADEVFTCVLISPQFSVHNDTLLWSWLEQQDEGLFKRTLYPSVADNPTPLANLWKYVIGETAVPSQPLGPVSVAFLRSLQKQDPRVRFAASGRPILIISESPDDTFSHDFNLLVHEATLYQPSWHWSAECRNQIVTRSLAWFVQHSSQLSIPISPSVEFTSWDIDHHHSIQIERDAQVLLGILCCPLQNASSAVCVIYEPGIPGQRVDIHRCGQRLATALSEVGLFAFRYDSRGTGVSDGEFHHYTWKEKLKDVDTVMQHLTDTYGIDRFVFIGNSSGARIASWIANIDQRVIGSVLWGPIFVEPSLRTGGNTAFRLPTGEIVSEFCGLNLSMLYTVEERRYAFLDSFKKCPKPTRIFFGDEEQNQINQSLIMNVASQKSNVYLTIVPGEHGFAPESMETVIRETVNWIMELVNGS